MDKWLIFIAAAFVAAVISETVRAMFGIKTEGPFVGRLILDVISMMLGAIMYALLFA